MSYHTWILWVQGYEIIDVNWEISCSPLLRGIRLARHELSLNNSELRDMSRGSQLCQLSQLPRDTIASQDSGLSLHNCAQWRVTSQLCQSTCTTRVLRDMSHVAQMNISCLASEWVMLRGNCVLRDTRLAALSCETWALRDMSHVARMNMTCHTSDWVMSQVKCVLRDTHLAAMSHVTHDTFVSLKTLQCGETHVCHDTIVS